VDKDKAPSSGSGGAPLASKGNGNGGGDGNGDNGDDELVTISTMGESEIFGEITFLEGHTASATVVASADVVDVLQSFIDLCLL
jgi:hypothetical protein